MTAHPSVFIQYSWYDTCPWNIVLSFFRDNKIACVVHFLVYNRISVEFVLLVGSRGTPLSRCLDDPTKYITYLQNESATKILKHGFLKWSLTQRRNTVALSCMAVCKSECANALEIYRLIKFERAWKPFKTFKIFTALFVESGTFCVSQKHHSNDVKVGDSLILRSRLRSMYISFAPSHCCNWQ